MSMKSLYNHKATAVWNEFVMVNKYEHRWGADHGWSGKFYRSSGACRAQCRRLCAVRPSGGGRAIRFLLSRSCLITLDD
jgi:hypothetical protein